MPIPQHVPQDHARYSAAPGLSELVVELARERDRLLPDEGGSLPGPTELMERRLRALRDWAGDPESTWQGAISREARMDRDRRRSALRAEKASLIAHARHRLADSEQLLHVPGRVRVVLAHRNDWFRGRVAAALSAAGVDVTDESVDGADAVGAIAAEQPDVALIEELLPTYRGLEVIERLQQAAPATRLAVQVADSSTAEQFQRRGVCAVLTRNMPPAEVAERLVQCAAEDQQP